MSGKWQSPSAEHRFVQVWSLTALALLVTGFAPSWFIRPLVEEPRGNPLDPVLIVHGVIFTIWLLIFIAQLFFVATGRPNRHQSLGRIVLLFIPLALLSSIHVAIRNAARPGGGAEPIPADIFLLLPLMEIVVFCILLWLGWQHRHIPHLHKRMMLFALAAIVGTGSGRLLGFIGTFFVPIALILSIWVFDWVRERRITRGVFFGGLLAASTYLLPLAVGFSAPWRQVAQQIISFYGSWFA